MPPKVCASIGLEFVCDLTASKKKHQTKLLPLMISTILGFTDGQWHTLSLSYTPTHTHTQSCEMLSMCMAFSVVPSGCLSTQELLRVLVKIHHNFIARPVAELSTVHLHMATITPNLPPLQTRTCAHTLHMHTAFIKHTDGAQCILSYLPDYLNVGMWKHYGCGEDWLPF